MIWTFVRAMNRCDGDVKIHSVGSLCPVYDVEAPSCTEAGSDLRDAVLCRDVDVCDYLRST